MTEIHTISLTRPTCCPACGLVIECITGHTERPDVVEGVVMCVGCKVFLTFRPNGEPEIRVLSNAGWAALEEPTRVFLTRLRDDFQRTDVPRGTSEKGSEK